MSDGLDDIRGIADALAPPPGPPEGRAYPEDLPPAFPVRPLGQADGVFRFLSARGELVALTAGQLAQRPTLVALFAGVAQAEGWLAWIAPKRSRSQDEGFNAARAADFLMAACSALPLYDQSTPVRHFGTWRSAGGAAVAHLGGVLETSDGARLAAGRLLDGAIYPAAHGRPGPGGEVADCARLEDLRAEIAMQWAWAEPHGADVFLGWIAMAALGQYPEWRAHLWLQGRPGSGKSTLLGVAHSLLGGASAGVQDNASPASIRQLTNNQALARIFDEAEGGGDHAVTEEIIALLRLMSSREGARMAKGTADHKGVVFRLYGAGLMASVVPGIMSPADRSRFVMLSLGRRPAAEGEDAAARAALGLAEVRAEAAALGPGLWRRMLVLAPERWDSAFTAYGGLVQALGGDGRAGDTIGTVMAGWDLALHDGPPTEARLVRAAEIVRPLLDAALEAEAEGDGERCLRALLAFAIPKEHGGAVPAWDLVQRLQVDDLDSSADTQALLARLGMRVLDGPRRGRPLFVRNGDDPVLNHALARTRWTHGNHRAALLMLDGCEASAGSVRVAGRKVRGVLIPARHLPGGEEGVG